MTIDEAVEQLHRALANEGSTDRVREVAARLVKAADWLDADRAAKAKPRPEFAPWRPETDSERIAAAVACPTCAAPAQHRCITARGRVTERGEYHAKRFRDGRRARTSTPK